ncbi:unnamed protein product [Hydatigera taeniaeformis]|uniref:Uncharacterized protein n=1 Tax=Hydatigena taeniaeformis TaxID=6205 RepID=A0A0R3XA05_HYDTA|nr:unnamed protein product [Hydatigera taeniaeformis]
MDDPPFLLLFLKLTNYYAMLDRRQKLSRSGHENFRFIEFDFDPQSAILPSSAKMRRRFNKSAAAVRARMAQKCKDERRFGRVLPSGTIATNSDRSHLSSSSATGAASSSSTTITSSTSITTSGNNSRQSTLNRRRSAAYAAASAPLAKNPRLSLAPQPPPPPPLPLPSVAPTQLVATPPMLTSLPSEAYVPPSAVNSAPATASVVHDPPVILASAPEMAS